MSVDPRLRILLVDLWPDIRVPGLPVWYPAHHGDHEFEDVIDGSSWGYYPIAPDPPDSYDPSPGWHLDLSRPGALDILARRVATACGLEPTHGTQWLCRDTWHGGQEAIDYPSWWLRSGGSRCFSCLRRDGWTHIPSLAALDPTDNTHLSWGKDGSLGTPRIVDLAALGLTAQDLSQRAAEA